VSNVNNMSEMFYGCTLSVENYNALLIGWATQNLTPSVSFSGGNSKYSCTAINARAVIIDVPNNWIITDGGIALDNTAPIADLSSLLTVSEECSVLILTAPTATDECEGTITATTTSVFPIQSSETITWTYTDGVGNFSTQTQDVLITDEIDPTITCPSNFTAVADNISQTYTQLGPELYPIAFEDNCSISSVTNDFNNTSSLNGSVFNIGTTTILWTVEDASGNQTTCSFDVTIETFVGIEVIDETSLFSVYPNPTNEQITIDYGSNFSTMNGYTLKITNSINQIVYTSPINSQQTTIDPSMWTGKGIYFVRIIDDKSKTLGTRKIVIE